ncbi:MAG: hypothetical protein ACQEUZ_12290 [Pseudomonadota bacterium]
MICKPTETAARADPFGFGDADMQVQGLRNLVVLMALPWAAVWAVGAEMTVEALRRAGL